MLHRKRLNLFNLLSLPCSTCIASSNNNNVDFKVYLSTEIAIKCEFSISCCHSNGLYTILNVVFRYSIAGEAHS